MGPTSDCTNDKTLAFANNIFNVNKITELVFDGIEDILRKGESAGYQDFFLILQCFQFQELITGVINPFPNNKF